MKPFLLASITIGALCSLVALAAQTAAPAVSIRDVAVNHFSLAVRGDGSVVAWGRAPGGVLAVPALQPAFHAAAPRVVFDGNYETALPANFDVSPDGRRFVMLKAIAPTVRETPHLIVVQNWFDELERLAPRK